jgi:bridging integrator 3
MIRMQSKFAEEGYEKLAGVQKSVVSLFVGCLSTLLNSMHRYFPDHVRDDYAAGQLDAQVRKLSCPLLQLMIP